MTEPLTFSNFFSDFYILHPFGEKAEEKLSENDRIWACVCSVILGACTLGLVHFGCWMAERCITPADTSDEKVQRESAVGRETMYTGNLEGQNNKKRNEEVIEKKTETASIRRQAMQEAPFVSPKDIPQGIPQNVTWHEPTRKSIAKGDETLFPGCAIPEVTRKSLNWLFGNDKIVERAPIYSVDKHATNYMEPESFEFPVMKGAIEDQATPAKLMPFIAIKVIPANPEAYFEKYESKNCRFYAKMTAKMVNELLFTHAVYLALKKSLLEQIVVPGGGDPETYFVQHEKDRCWKKAEGIAHTLKKDYQEKSVAEIYSVLREKELESMKEMIVIEDPEDYFEEHRKDICENEANTIASALKEIKPRTADEFYLNIKKEKFEEINKGKMVRIQKFRGDEESLSWVDYYAGLGGGVPGLFQFRTPEAIFAQSLLTSKDTGEVIAEAKKGARNFQTLISTGVATDAYGETWKIADYEKVKELL